MSYTVLLLRSVQKEIGKLPKSVYPKISEALRALTENPRPIGCLKLRAREGWRIRIGVYRILYEIDDEQKTITIVHIGHRRDVYN